MQLVCTVYGIFYHVNEPYMGTCSLVPPLPKQNGCLHCSFEVLSLTKNVEIEKLFNWFMKLIVSKYKLSHKNLLIVNLMNA